MSYRKLLWTLSAVSRRTAPFWRRSWKYRAVRLLVIGPSTCYAGVLIMMLFQENILLYRAAGASASWCQPPAGVSVEDIGLAAADGTPLHAWWSAPWGWRPADGALLFCHGNGGNLSDRGGCFLPFQRHLETGVLVVEYPGYGRSGGAPSERGCYAAGDAAYDWLTQTRGVRGDRVILYGGSLGGGVATDLAVRRPHRALVLVSTFTSFPDQAQKVCPWLPARWLVRNRFDNLAKIASVSGPVFVAHSRADTLVPFWIGERLFAAVAGPKRFFAMDNWDHNDQPEPRAYAALRAFLDANVPPRPR
jgi:fermentation-respiration switch protein FrsA (DUF1100 family)